MTEQWLPTEYGYEVSSLGRVRAPWGTLRKFYRDPQGRLAVSLTYPGKKVITRRVHRLVALAFIGPPPTPRHEVRHLNGDPGDNRVENLAWGTSKENGEDMVAHGRSVRGARNHKSRLTESQVIEVVDKIRAGALQHEVAVELGVSQPTIAQIMSGRNWSWLTGITGFDPTESSARRKASAVKAFQQSKAQFKRPCPGGCGLVTFPGPLGKHLKESPCKQVVAAT